MSAFQASLLVATPALRDPNFRQSVVLMLHASVDQAFGVVLNQPTDRSIAEIWDAFFHHVCPIKGRIFVGGPVFGPILVLHTDEELADSVVLPGLFCSAKKESIEKLIASECEPIRVYFGGAGWGKNQLQEEIRQGAWYVLPAVRDDIFADPAEMWKIKLETAGRGLLGYILGKSEFPEDACVN